MKSKIKIIIAVLALIFCSNVSYPQNTDLPVKEFYYNFRLIDGTIYQGKVVSVDSIYVILFTENGLEEFKLKEISEFKRIKKNTVIEKYYSFRKPEYKNFGSFTVGVMFPKYDNSDYYNGYYYYYYENSEVNTGFEFTAMYTGFFSRLLALRTGFSFTIAENKDYNYKTYYGTNSRSGGTLSQSVVGIDFLCGMFHPEKKVNFYFLAGIGIGSENGSEVKISIRENYAYGEFSENYTIDPQSEWMFRYGYGGGLTYRLSEKLSLMAEADYEYISNSGNYDNLSELKIKAGIIFVNF